MAAFRIVRIEGQGSLERRDGVDWTAQPEVGEAEVGLGGGVFAIRLDGALKGPLLGERLQVVVFADGEEEVDCLRVPDQDPWAARIYDLAQQIPPIRL